MNLTLVLLIFFFLVAVLGAAVFYYLTLQNLAAVKREVDKLRDQADDARASALLRNERARCYQQLMALEADIQARGNAKMVVLSKVTGDHIPVLNNSIEVIQVQQNTILQLRAAEQAATDEAAKARIKEELAKATDVLTKNAEFMGKTYGVVTNNLVFDVLEAHFWVALTPDELKAYVAQNHGTAAQALAEATDAPKLDVKKDKKSS